MNALERLMREIADVKDSSSKILPEAAISRLREYADLITAPNPFNVGDIVTTRADCNVKGHGEPHVVVKIDEGGLNYGSFDAGQSGSGDIANVLVVCFASGAIVTYPLPHWKLQPYTQN